MKYVDAKKLKAEIERYENTAIDAYNPLGEDAIFWHGKVVACEDLRALIDSLQQEQPEVFDTVAFQKGVKEGKRLAIDTIQSRIDEILGDAQPNPILRMELQELIKKIEL